MASANAICNPWGRSGSVPYRAYDLAAEEALKLIWFAGRSKASLPRAAMVRWFRRDGKSDAAAFASEPMPFPLATESRLAPLFPLGGLLRSAVVTARALKDIAPVRSDVGVSDRAGFALGDAGSKGMLSA